MTKSVKARTPYAVVVERHARSSSLRSIEVAVLRATQQEVAYLTGLPDALAAAIGVPALNSEDHISTLGPIRVRTMEDHGRDLRGLLLDQAALKELLLAIDRGALSLEEASEAAQLASDNAGFLVPATTELINRRLVVEAESILKGEGDPVAEEEEL